LTLRAPGVTSEQGSAHGNCVLAGFRHLIAVLLALAFGAAQTACACAAVSGMAAEASLAPHASQVSGEGQSHPTDAHPELSHGEGHDAHSVEHSECGHNPEDCDAGHQSAAVLIPGSYVSPGPAFVSAPADLVLPAKYTPHTGARTHDRGPVSFARPPPRPTPVSLKVRFLN
jgi:hypothetical protein